MVFILCVEGQGEKRDVGLIQSVVEETYDCPIQAFGGMTGEMMIAIRNITKV